MSKMFGFMPVLRMSSNNSVMASGDPPHAAHMDRYLSDFMCKHCAPWVHRRLLLQPTLLFVCLCVVINGITLFMCLWCSIKSLESGRVAYTNSDMFGIPSHLLTAFCLRLVSVSHSHASSNRTRLMRPADDICTKCTFERAPNPEAGWPF